MTQETQAKRPAAQQKIEKGPPGIGPVIAIAMISGAAFWYWQEAGGASSVKAIAPNMSELAQVEARDIAPALTTMNVSNATLAKFQDGKEGCRPPLAWVSLVSAPDEPPSHIRLISGNYFSPIFEVSATPIRVAIPYPAPYETGQGVLTAIDVGGGATVALFPPWRVSAQDGKAMRFVTWTPVKSCSQRNG